MNANWINFSKKFFVSFSRVLDSSEGVRFRFVRQVFLWIQF